MADGHAGPRCQPPDLGFDPIKLGDAFEPVFGDGGGAVAGDFKEFAAGMSPAIGQLDDGTSPVGLDETVIARVAVYLLISTRK